MQILQFMLLKLYYTPLLPPPLAEEGNKRGVSFIPSYKKLHFFKGLKHIDSLVSMINQSIARVVEFGRHAILRG